MRLTLRQASRLGTNKRMRLERGELDKFARGVRLEEAEHRNLFKELPTVEELIKWCYKFPQEARAEHERIRQAIEEKAAQVRRERHHEAQAERAYRFDEGPTRIRRSTSTGWQRDRGTQGHRSARP